MTELVSGGFAASRRRDIGVVGKASLFRSTTWQSHRNYSELQNEKAII